MSDRLSVSVLRYGDEAPLPERQTLHAGPLSCVLEGGDLRHIRLGEHEIVQRLYMAVRDRNWDTIPPHYTRFDVDDRGTSFRVDLEAEHVGGEVDFAWTGTIEGFEDGSIRYAMDGAPRKPFARNRIGFCVLHPMELAGVEAEVETPEGVTQGAFPQRISPHQPFLDMVAISHPAGPGARATIRFQGDLFEMEDQRNWTDASYKTYSTPLRIPYPVEVDPSTRIEQAVTIVVEGGRSVEAEQAETRPAVRVMFDRQTPMPAIGFGAGDRPIPVGEQHERFLSLQPAHLWAEIDLGEEHWVDELHIASAVAFAHQVPLDLSVTAGRDEAIWTELAEEIVRTNTPLGRVFVFPPADDPVTFPRTDLTTHRGQVPAARAAFESARLSPQIGGGARSYFTELNRAGESLPLDEMEVITFPLNPQVHATDLLSIVENIAAQAETVTSARAIAGDELPLVVGPISFKPPYNPNATAPEPEPEPGELPPSVDPRQLSLLGAGWTVGSIHRLANAGANALTYFRLQGWRGLIERAEVEEDDRPESFPSFPEQIFPVYHVFAAASDFVGGTVPEVELADPLAVEALALLGGDRLRLLVASFSEEQTDVTLEVLGLSEATLRVLDETTYAEAANDPMFFRAAGDPVTVDDGRVTLTLKPFAVACVEGRVDSGQ